MMNSLMNQLELFACYATINQHLKREIQGVVFLHNQLSDLSAGLPPAFRSLVDAR